MTGAIITATNESYGDVSILSHELDKIKLKKTYFKCETAL